MTSGSRVFRTPERAPLPGVPAPIADPRALVAERLGRGFVVVDKPAGMTSHDVVDALRRAFGIAKIGHSGTLDPAVTGVLPLGLGQGTRLLGLLLKAGKVYRAHVHLHGDVAEAAVRATLLRQVGTITQTPPRRSRVKRVPREREVYALAVRAIAGREVHFDVTTEAGTYIRTLAVAIGEDLGVGAHLARLRRLAAGGFTLDDAAALAEIEQAAKEWRVGAAAALAARLSPIEAMLADTPKVWIGAGAVVPIATGAPLALPGVLQYEPFAASDRVALMTADGEVVALAEALCGSDGLADRSRGLIAQPRTVLWPVPGRPAAPPDDRLPAPPMAEERA